MTNKTNAAVDMMQIVTNALNNAQRSATIKSATYEISHFPTIDFVRHDALDVYFMTSDAHETWTISMYDEQHEHSETIDTYVKTTCDNAQIIADALLRASYVLVQQTADARAERARLRLLNALATSLNKYRRLDVSIDAICDATLTDDADALFICDASNADRVHVLSNVRETFMLETFDAETNDDVARTDLCIASSSTDVHAITSAVLDALHILRDASIKSHLKIEINKTTQQ